jgi:broad specificity phosphatase PhoE
MNNKNINFCFVRHGYSCTNALSNLVNNNVISVNESNSFKNPTSFDLKPLNDPELTPIGVDASINNGCIISKIIRSIYKISGKKELNIEKINIVGCSPLIRCMETAYYMTRKWNNPPNKIYVFPLLREIDESSENKYSQKSRIRMETKPSYAIKSIKEQKEYLKKLGILEFFDFTFVEKFPDLRKEPGDIKQFIKWFYDNFLPLIDQNNNLNIFITTHAGVLRDFSDEGFVNNSGFLINTQQNEKGGKFEFKDYVSFNNFLPNFFFQDYSKSIYNGKEYFCPNNRCGQLCSIARGKNVNSIEKINIVECSSENEDL